MSATRARLIEQEARRRALRGGYDPDMPANRLLGIEEDGPLWRVCADHVESKIGELEKAGFTVLPPRDGSMRADHWAAGLTAAFVLTPVLVVGLAIVLGWI